jgi:8-oxo-dGTP pyrophosphatase MutT (NUDIX family)
MSEPSLTLKEREESFGAVVFRGEGTSREVLLVRTDHWGFPKGHKEGDEDELSAAVREVKEESNIDVEILHPSEQYLEEYEIRRTGVTTRKTVTYFVGVGRGEPIPQPGEVYEAGWFRVEKALEILSFESAKNTLKSLVYS